MTTSLPVAMIDALNGTFGKHAGKRASHAKGFCAVGEFTPTTVAANFADSSLFKGGRAPAVLRFSVAGGNPGVSDKVRSARGVAIRIDNGDEFYDLVLLSEAVFFAANPASFISFLQARVPDPETKKPDPAKVAAHNEAHPDGKLQPSLVAAHAAPASYATTPYFSNNAFVFRGADGVKRHARIELDPTAGTRYLSEEQEQNFPDQFLEAELAARLSRGAADFTLYALLPAASDSLTDPSAPWQGAGRIALGTLRVTAVAEQNSCDGMLFMPLNLPASIEASDDPILASRAAAYAESLARRRQ